MGAGEELAVRSAVSESAAPDFVLPLPGVVALEATTFFVAVAFVAFEAELAGDVMRFGAFGVGVVVQTHVPLLSATLDHPSLFHTPRFGRSPRHSGPQS